ncbi:MAG: co-chaperone GroES family protein [Candidatus Thiodiazotropha lotti]|nr:co-chaperone GroES family protein [Candidatus Thiodiazotropha lotti]MCW4221812.1 co-chaperone GroES family protein [Candidatus Thiodiazotropha lotti]
MTNEVAGYVPVEASLWRILVDPIPVETERGGIALPKETQELQAYRRFVAQVVDIGPLAFTGDRFKDEDGISHPACKVGDWIVMGRNNGIDITLTEGDEDVRTLKLINDDQVLGRVKDITRIYNPL